MTKYELIKALEPFTDEIPIKGVNDNAPIRIFYVTNLNYEAEILILHNSPNLDNYRAIVEISR